MIAYKVMSIAPENVFNQLSVIAVLYHRGFDGGNIADVTNTVGRLSDAVQIAAKGDGVLAAQINIVIDVAQQR